MMSASAPGKVLICGGYLIVESPNSGISIGVSSRFRTTIVNVATVPASENTPERSIFVKIFSPQFHTQFIFEIVNCEASVTVKQNDGPDSPFLKYALLYSFGYVLNRELHCDTHELNMTLEASNDFYSQRNYLEERKIPVTTQALRELPHALPLEGSVSKTGLGSSAAMTTSVVACILTKFGCTSDEDVHRVAQVAHSVAQGKIGSGFDVYTATYGTCEYRRFSPALVEALTKADDMNSVNKSEISRLVLQPQPWVNVSPLKGLPPNIKLVLGDIHQGGSNTPGLVAKVNAWHRSVECNPENLWNQLQAANTEYIAALRLLHAGGSENEQFIRQLGEKPYSLWEAEGSEKKWHHLGTCARKCRSLLREMGIAGDVEIEPAKLTPLLDATMALPGVIVSGCPGAGGYDAVFALVVEVSGSENTERVEKFWESYQGLSIVALPVREDHVGVQREARAEKR